MVTVRYYDGKVQLKAARPNSGYYVYTPEQRSPDEVVVYFLTKDVTYIVRAFYKDGQPAYDVQRRSNR